MKFPLTSCNPKLNGEASFYENIKDQIKVIFDVGCRHDSVFTEFNGDVHYFEPVLPYLKQLSVKKNKNSMSKFNSFGLGDRETTLTYYVKYQSFYDRVASCGEPSADTLRLNVKKGINYVKQNNISQIDLLKIDTEGFEFNVLKGFEDFLRNIKIIQFEYGGTYLDSGVKLKEIINYLSQYGFTSFSYLSPEGLIGIYNCNDIPINPQAKPYTKSIKTSGLEDHYNYCNIVCFNNNQ